MLSTQRKETSLRIYLQRKLFLRPFAPPEGGGGWTGDGREEQKLPISNSFPPDPPTKSRRQRRHPRENTYMEF